MVLTPETKWSLLLRDSRYGSSVMVRTHLDTLAYRCSPVIPIAASTMLAASPTKQSVTSALVSQRVPFPFTNEFLSYHWLSTQIIAEATPTILIGRNAPTSSLINARTVCVLRSSSLLAGTARTLIAPITSHTCPTLSRTTTTDIALILTPYTSFPSSTR